MSQRKNVDKAIDLLNQIFNNANMFNHANRKQKKQRNDYIFFRNPRNWTGTIYRFAYTPWKTLDPETGKTGYWSLKYKYIKSTKQLKLVKKVRFGKRKIAKNRAIEWYKKHYGK